MARRYFSSTAQRTTVATDISAGGTTLVVAAVTGFPSSRPYTLVLDLDTVNEEIVTVTAVSGTTLTVTRGVDGTTGVAHTAGAVVAHCITARDVDEPNAHVNATTDVHGLTGAPAPAANPTFTGTVVLPSTTSIGTVSSTELGYVGGVTSAIQTQIDSKPTKTYASSAPGSPATGAIWFDTNYTPPRAKFYDGSSWQLFSNAAAPTVNEGSSTGFTFSTLTNPDGDGVNYRMGVCTAGGSLVVTVAGVVQALLVGGGNNYAVSPTGNGGPVRAGSYLLPAATHTVTVGAAGVPGGASSIGTAVVTAAAGIGINAPNAQGAGATAGALSTGFTSSITGSALVYGRAQAASPVANRGDAGTAGTATDGVVIVRWVTP